MPEDYYAENYNYSWTKDGTAIDDKPIYHITTTTGTKIDYQSLADCKIQQLEARIARLEERLKNPTRKK